MPALVPVQGETTIGPHPGISDGISNLPCVVIDPRALFSGHGAGEEVTPTTRSFVSVVDWHRQLNHLLFCG